MYLYKLIKEKYFWDNYYKTNINLMNIINFKKIIINIGCGNIFNNKDLMSNIFNNLYNISGVLPVFIKCKKSVASFKIRKDNIIAIKVTLRKRNMYNFIDKLINLVFPKIKSFKGFSFKSFDKFNNFNFGLLDYNDFLEVENKFENTIGMNINIIFNNNNNINFILNLLNFLNFPINV